MSSQPPYDPYNQQIPPTQYAQQSEFVPANPYPPQPSNYPPPNPYDTPSTPPPNPYAPPVYGQQPVYPYPATPQPERGRGLAIAGMILGIISMVAWLLPFLGFPTAIVGLILSILGRRSVTRKGMALAGIILSSIALALSICNAAAGIWIRLPH